MPLILFPVAALAFLVWQACLTFDEEVKYIWACVLINRRSCLPERPDAYTRMHNKNPFKWMYFYLRYVVIVGHVCVHGSASQASLS